MKMKSKMMLLKVIALWFCAILVLTGCAGKAESYQDKYDLGSNMSLRAITRKLSLR